VPIGDASDTSRVPQTIEPKSRVVPHVLAVPSRVPRTIEPKSRVVPAVPSNLMFLKGERLCVHCSCD
jgi:hypothetical protein